MRDFFTRKAAQSGPCVGEMPTAVRVRFSGKGYTNSPHVLSPGTSSSANTLSSFMAYTLRLYSLSTGRWKDTVNLERNKQTWTYNLDSLRNKNTFLDHHKLYRVGSTGKGYIFYYAYEDWDWGSSKFYSMWLVSLLIRRILKVPHSRLWCWWEAAGFCLNTTPHPPSECTQGAVFSPLCPDTEVLSGVLFGLLLRSRTLTWSHSLVGLNCEHKAHG